MMNARGAVACTIFSLFALAQGAAGQGKTDLRVDGNRIKGYIEYLSTDEMMGRQSMTPEYQEAAEWVAAQYEAWGLEPAGDDGTYFQRVPINRGLTFYTGVPGLSVNGIEASLTEGDFTVLPVSTAATAVEGEVVFLGYGISAPEKGLDEYAGMDVRGKVVLALSGSPNDAPAPRTGGSMAPGEVTEPEPEEEWVEESKDATKQRVAFEKGAAAILLFNPDPPVQGVMMFRRPGPQEDEFEPTGDFLAFTVVDRVFRSIMKPDPQESVRGFTTRLNGLRNAIKYGTPQSAATGARVSLKGYDAKDEYNEELGNDFAYNVVAKLPGSDPELSGEFVVMGGHLDHLGVRDGQVYNGADDNASGTAVAMEVARVLKEGGHRPARTVIFTAWCGEEMGLIGSNYFVANPPDGIDMDHVVTYFNMDMVGLGDAIGAPGALNFPTIWDVIRRDQDDDVMAAVQPRPGGPGGSDHSAFINLGIEALALMTSGGVGHPYYHRPEDDTEKIDPEILRKTGQFVLQGTVNLANERETDLLIDGRQDIFRAMQMSITPFNPGQGDHPVVPIPVQGKDELIALVLDSALAVNSRLNEQPAQAQAATPQMMYRRMSMGDAKVSFSRGIDDLTPFEGDLPLLLAASDLLGFGRVDVAGDDGFWVVGGELSPAGWEAFKSFEENDIWVHISSPTEDLLQGMLDLASKPFIVTGDYTVSPAMVGAINEKGVVLGITIDPSRIDAAVAEIDGMKTLLGDTDNLVLGLTTAEMPEDAKQALYMGLLERGWTHEEIAGQRRAGGGIAGGNLSAFAPARRMMMRR